MNVYTYLGCEIYVEVIFRFEPRLEIMNTKSVE